jgi:hypothetical protein
MEELEKLDQRVEDGTFRAQFEYGTDELRLEILGMADLLFEVADKVEEVLTDLMVRKGFGVPGSEEESPPDAGES